MRFSQLQQLISTQWAEGRSRDIFFVQSEPGIGKSALAHLLATTGGFDNVAEINASLLDTPDLAGLALLNGDSDVLQFKKPPLLAPLQGDGRNLVIWEEISDSNIGMQNLVARWAYDGNVNGMFLSPNTFHLMLGNRSKDKSGAGRVSTKLSNRVCVLEMEANLDDWVDWALANNVNPIGIQFLRFKPNLFSAFNPDAPLGINPTPRAWTRAFATSDNLPTDLYFNKVKGEVGEGPAAEYTAFRKIYQSLVSFEDIVMNPTGVKIPSDLSAQFAIVGSVAHNVTVGNIDRVAEFVARLPSDFGVMFWNDAMRKTPALKATKPFIKWASSATNVLMN